MNSLKCDEYIQWNTTQQSKGMTTNIYNQTDELQKH